MSLTGEPTIRSSTPQMALLVLRGRITSFYLLGNALPNEAKEPGGLSHKHMFLAHVQVGVHQDLKGLFCKAAFQTDVLKPVLVRGVIPPQGESMTFTLVELGSFLQPVKVSLNPTTV